MQYLPVLRQGPEAAARSAGSCHHRSSVWSVSPPAEFPAGPLLPAPVHSHDDCSDLVLHAVAHDVRGDLVHHVFHEAVLRTVPFQIVTDAFKKYVSRREKNIPLLSEYAHKLRVEERLRAYLEVLL